MKKPLQGAHVLVTRPIHQAENLCRLITGQGGRAVRFPTLQIVGIDAQSVCPMNQKTSGTNPLSHLSNYYWLIFTSANAVNFALKANNGKIAEFKATRIAAIGQATANELKAAGLDVDLMPDQGFDSETLLNVPQLKDVNGRNILIVRGQGGREELAKVLSDRGAAVEYWEVYKRATPENDSSELINLLDLKKIDVMTITSTESLQNLLVILGQNYKKALAVIPLVVISNRIKRFAADIGFKRIDVAECPSDEAILDKVIAIYNEDNSG